MPTTIKYRQNGTGNAFLRELGCSCPQCATARSKPQTSGSLVIADEKGLRYHLLFDCGLGIVDSLIDAGIGKVTHAFISHNHPDHCLELDRLLQGQLRSATRAGDDVRIPCYCTAGTRAKGPDHLFPYLRWDRVNVLAGRPITPCSYCAGVYADPGLGINLTIKPVLVYHGNPAIVPEPVIWVLEFDTEQGRRKLVLGWDFLHLVPRIDGEDQDMFYRGPLAPRLPASLHVLLDADLLVLEGNTWSPHPETGHTCIETGLRVTVPLLSPRGPVWFVHFSGHEDVGGALSDSDLSHKIEGEAARLNLQKPTRLAVPGDEVTFYF